MRHIEKIDKVVYYTHDHVCVLIEMYTKMQYFTFSMTYRQLYGDYIFPLHCALCRRRAILHTHFVYIHTPREWPSQITYVFIYEFLKVKAIPSHTSNTLLCKLSAMMKLLEKFNILAVGVTSHKLRHLEMGVR